MAMGRLVLMVLSMMLAVLVAAQVVAAQTTYISYGAMAPNSALCPSASPGASYYNGCPPAPTTADPYARACTEITKCARG